MEDRKNNRSHSAPVTELKPHCARSGKGVPLKVALITNHPPPFRIPIYERIARVPGIDFTAIFCSEREPNRHWDLPPLRFNHVFLKERFVTRGDNFIHNNPDVLSALGKLSPQVIVTTGFNPTFLYAFGYAVAKGIAYVPMTDGTDISEVSLSRWHKAIRRIIYRRSMAFIAASHGGLKLYASYGIPREKCFQSCLCIDNNVYSEAANAANAVGKSFDLIFCGRIVPDKNPLFALDVAAGVAARLDRRVSILFVGSGELEDEITRRAAVLSDRVETAINGHAQQDELPALYASARVFLFPTARDVWGVVGNEACAAGLPIIVSPEAGVADELVLEGENGFVCGLELEQWIDRAVLLLSNEAVYQRFSQRSRALASHYTFDHAAMGIVDACRYAVGLHHDVTPDSSDWKVG